MIKDGVVNAQIDAQPGDEFDSSTPAEALRSRFSVLPGASEQVRNEVFRLRHEIFCDEFRLFDKRMDGLEQDEFDAHSVQLLLKHARTGQPVGCVRVVKTRPGNHAYPLPFEKYCGDMLSQTTIDLSSLPREKIAEVSRLGVAPTFRRRKGESNRPAPLLDAGVENSDHVENPRRYPYILISLYLGSVAIAHHEGIETLFTFTEIRLVEHFQRLGVPITPIHPPVSHKGVRLPCMLSVNETVKGFQPYVRGLYDEIVAQMDHQYSGGMSDGLEIKTGKSAS